MLPFSIIKVRDMNEELQSFSLFSISIFSQNTSDWFLMASPCMVRYRWNCFRSKKQKTTSLCSGCVLASLKREIEEIERNDCLPGERNLIMSNIIRLCHPFNFRIVLEYHDGTFKGLFSWFASDLLASITRASNISFEIRSQNDRFGNPIAGADGAYSGCIGLLQTNQSDAMMYLENYPHPAANISQGMVMTDIAINIMTYYEPSDSGMRIPAQMEEAFLAFKPSVWALCVATMLTSIIALFAKQSLDAWVSRMRSRENMDETRIGQVTYEIIVHMLQYGEISYSTGLFGKLLYSTLSLFALLVIFYLCSYVNTELVVTPAPKTIRSYQEMLKAGCAAYFISGSDIYRSFKSAPNGSIEKTLWDYSVAKYGMNLTLFSHGENSHMVGVIGERWFSGKIGLIDGSDTTRYQMQAGCSGWLNEEKRSNILRYFNMNISADTLHLPLMSRDERAQAIQHGFISSIFINPAVDRLKVTLRRVFEAGIPNLIKKFIKNAGNLDVVPSWTIGNATFGNMQQCMESVLFMPEVELAAVTAGNFSNFPLYGLYLLTIQIFILLMEKTLHRHHENNNILPDK